MDERSQALEIRARTVGLRQHIARPKYKPTLECNELALLAS
ncbi:MAG TPA: hypothetical protein VJ840_03410 [Gemmatimonadaceae bacterium]|nr:hypothetical protein [Gemmatimonadaceae bacterium]